MRRHLLLLALVVGCGAPPDAPSPTAETEGPTATPAPESDIAADAPPLDLPETRTDTVHVEGEPQVTTLHLVREDEAPLPFATYRPEDVDYESVSSGEGDGYRFTFGEPPFDAHLHVFVPSPTSGMDDPEAYAQGLAGGGVALEPMGDTAPWVEAAYQWRHDGRVGSVMAGTHDGRRFYAVEDLQEEMGDGFAPRANTVLDEWRWLPGGESLQ